MPSHLRRLSTFKSVRSQRMRKASKRRFEGPEIWYRRPRRLDAFTTFTSSPTLMALDAALSPSKSSLSSRTISWRSRTRSRCAVTSAVNRFGISGPAGADERLNSRRTAPNVPTRSRSGSDFAPADRSGPTVPGTDSTIRGSSTDSATVRICLGDCSAASGSGSRSSTAMGCCGWLGSDSVKRSAAASKHSRRLLSSANVAQAWTIKHIGRCASGRLSQFTSASAPSPDNAGTAARALMPKKKARSRPRRPRALMFRVPGSRRCRLEPGRTRASWATPA